MFIISFVGLVDLLYLWIAGGALPGPLASFLRLEEWRVRGLGLLFGGTMLGFALALATASLEPVDIQHGNSRYSFSGFKGATPGLRKASKITTSAACLLAALFGFAVLFDVATASLYVIRNASGIVIRNASGIQIAWAILLFGAGILAYSAVSEKEWSLLSWILCITACLALLIAAEQFQPTADPTDAVRKVENALDVAEAASAIYEAGKFYLVIALLLIVGGRLVFDGKWIAAAVVLCIVGFMLADGCDTPIMGTRQQGDKVAQLDNIAGIH